MMSKKTISIHDLAEFLYATKGYSVEETLGFIQQLADSEDLIWIKSEIKEILERVDRVRKYTVKYWVYNTWPSSIDKRPSPDARLETIEVSLDEIYIKDGHYYYRLQSGHGVSTELLIK